jgi:hypothetical protein
MPGTRNGFAGLIALSLVRQDHIWQQNSPQLSGLEWPFNCPFLSCIPGCEKSGLGYGRRFRPRGVLLCRAVCMQARAAAMHDLVFLSGPRETQDVTYP